MDQVRTGEGEYIVNQFKHRNTLLLELSASLEREDALKQQLAEARSERGHAYQLATELEQQRDELLKAAENLIRVKGRHHTEQAYKQLETVIAKVKP